MKLNFVLSFVCILYSCDAARILVLGPIGTYSHKLIYMPIVQGLAEKGHNVTVISPFPPKTKVENVREIIVENVDDSSIDFFMVRNFKGIFSVAPRLWVFGTLLSIAYDKLMGNEEFRQILHSEQFDLILIDAIFNDFCLPLADQWKAPIITVSASIGPPWVVENMGVPHNFASYPSGWTSYDNEMNLIQRCLNTLEAVLTANFRDLFILNPLNSKIRKTFPQARTIQEVEKDISLCIVNSHPVFNWQRPMPPTVIEVSGLHIKPPKPLPSELQKFADESGEHGFILFTLGSMIKSSTIPKATVQVFLRVFREIPQRVIWKWEADEKPPNLPHNVLLVKWLPQSDLLAHPNVRLFITHGGLLGTQEAVSYQVPLLGLPVVNDQFINMNKISKEGAGLSLEWTQIDDSSLKATLDSLLLNPSFKGNITRLNNLMVDEPMPSKEKAVYWVEYVLRHRGTKHMRMSFMDLPFYQHYLIDVIAVIIMVVLLITFSVILTVRWLCIRTKRSHTITKQKAK